MQTQCPHCDTRFRITESQVNIADGFVRCSVCKEVFNAIEVAEQHEHQRSLLEQQSLAGNEADNETNEQADVIVEQIYTDDIDEITSDTEQTEIMDAATHINADADAMAATEATDFNETSATDDSRKDAFDFFDEEANESLSHVVPDKYKDSHHSSSTTLLSSLLWGAGILLLSATLFIEYAWFNRDQLNQQPQLQAWTEKLCQQIECKDITMRNPEKIELIARNVYSHPNEKNALMINITMKNHADFAQPYPIMQINFSDVRGGDVAARRFLPAEYLPEEYLSTQKRPLLEPDTNMTFTMEIQDPGKQAMTYEFDFL